MTQQEFIEKYNALCEEAGMQIIPQMQLTVVPKEMPKEQTQTGEQTTDEEEGQKPAK